MKSKFSIFLFTVLCFGHSYAEYKGCQCEVIVDPVNILGEWRQKTSDKPVKELDFLITGCARSGTLYITKVFQQCGLGVKHENWNPTYGMVSWPMAVVTEEHVWGPATADFSFKHIFHQVRHPLKTIGSCLTEPNRSWRYICRYAPQIKMEDSKMIKAAKYWYYWNLKAEGRAEMTYQVEKLAKAFPEIAKRLGVELDPKALNRVPKTTNTRQHKQLTWYDLRKAIDPQLFCQIVCLAKRYGYDVSDAYNPRPKKLKKDKI